MKNIFWICLEQEFRQKSREWDQQKRGLQKQVDSLEAQNKSLADKCDLVQVSSSVSKASVSRSENLNSQYSA